RRVAVKLINPNLRNESTFDARFQREARIASQLHDPHIVVVHDFGLDSDHGPYLVMEYLEGQSLRERLASEGPLPLKAVLQMANGLFLALIHAHGRGIVHRDIKPDNIFLLHISGVKLHVRVLDFGIARIYRGEEQNEALTLTNAGVVLGTPRYMSPEQLAGRPVDARSDLYSAALVLYEALTGELPLGSGKRLGEQVPEASEPLQQLLEECLQANPDDRPRSALEVYLRLQDAGKASGILMLPPGMLERAVAARHANEPTVLYAGPPTKRRIWLSLVGSTLCLALLGMLVWWFSLREPASDTERLLGLSLGATPAQVAQKVAFSLIHQGDPWKSVEPIPLGGTLQPADLGGDPERVTTRWTRDEATCGLFRGERLIGLISSAGTARTGRGVRVGSTLNHVIDCYPEEHYTTTERVDGVQVDVLRYDSLGIGFEVRGKTVTRITLYHPIP
ncbi:MAG: serine/threonine-protein kinase, partial [Gemmataceae bacterium]